MDGEKAVGRGKVEDTIPVIEIRGEGKPMSAAQIRHLEEISNGGPLDVKVVCLRSLKFPAISHTLICVWKPCAPPLFVTYVRIPPHSSHSVSEDRMNRLHVTQGFMFGFYAEAV